MPQPPRPALLASAFAVLAMSPAAGLADGPAGPDGDVRSFLAANCADCHADGAAEGGFELGALGADLSDRDAFRRWRRVHDRVEQGEMPPADAWQPDDGEKVAALRRLATALDAADRDRQNTDGRVTARRLNRVEFETTLSDLLRTTLDVADLLPADAEAEGFATVGSALNVSGVQMEAYLAAIDDAIDQAVVFTERPVTQTFRLSLLQNHGYMQVYRSQHPALPVVDGMALFATEAMSHHHALWGQYVVPRTGRYRVRVSAYKIHSDGPIALTLRVGGDGHKESLREKHRILEHLEVASDAPEVHEWEGDLNRGHFFHLYPSELPVSRVVKKDSYPQARWTKPGVVVQWLEVEGPLVDSWPPPGQEALFGGVPLEPIAGTRNADPNGQLHGPPLIPADPRHRPKNWPPAGSAGAAAKSDVTDGTRRRSKNVVRDILAGRHPPAEPLPDYTRPPHDLKPGDPLPRFGGEPVYQNVSHPGPLVRTLRLAPEDPKADADRLIRRMLPLAFRRPVSDEEADRYVRFVHGWLDEGVDFESAMRTGYKAVFTSPQFLFHQASLPAPAPASADRHLDEYALAERLSYFLWNTAPDAELRALAADGTLSRPAVLRDQTGRLLSDDRAGRFVEDFLGQWLDLYEIEATSPDTHLYPEYDAVLHDSMLMESHAFFAHLLKHDLPAKNLIESDFVTVNRRLAQHYRIEGARGMLPVVTRLPGDSVRGGLLTQAAVLKVTANGTNTSPVIRGKWVLERLLGTPPDPPPPGIPAVEPDIRGAVTIRAQLEQHRAIGNCASCHAKIDPPGVALENFDPVGRFRDRYRILDPDKADLKQADASLRYNEGLPVDASYETADGRAFRDIRDLKRILSEDERAVARTLADRLLVYATGATTSFSDRAAIETIVDDAGEAGYGVRSIVHAVVQNELFRRR